MRKNLIKFTLIAFAALLLTSCAEFTDPSQQIQNQQKQQQLQKQQREALKASLFN